ncbi:MAG: hypothetical protein ACI977_000108 [Candidatus Nanohaloarchaea archaeon]|jgi:hypothetical protein
MMAFDLDGNSEEVAETRELFAGRTPEYTELLGAAEYIQEEYFDNENVASIGNITLYPGGHSTEARRPLSASVDLVFRGDPPEDLGEEYPSWSFAESYFVDYTHVGSRTSKEDQHIEVAMVDIDNFPLFDFDSEALEEAETHHLTYLDSETGHTFDYDIIMAKPEQSVASKFNRLNTVANNGEGIVKGSDSIDMASHLHWGHTTNEMSLERLAQVIEQKVEPPYKPGLESTREAKSNFAESERKDLEKAISSLEDNLEV